MLFSPQIASMGRAGRVGNQCSKGRGTGSTGGLLGRAAKVKGKQQLNLR